MLILAVLYWLDIFEEGIYNQKSSWVRFLDSKCIPKERTSCGSDWIILRRKELKFRC